MTLIAVLRLLDFAQLTLAVPVNLPLGTKLTAFLRGSSHRGLGFSQQSVLLIPVPHFR